MRAKLTEQLVAQMADLKSDGLSNKDICRAVGIHESTLYRWLSGKGKLHRALGESLKKAEAGYKRTLLSTIRDAAMKRNGQWTAAAWLLERRYPEEFAQGARDRAAKGSEAAPQIMLGVTVAPVKGSCDDAGVRADADGDEGGKDG